VSAWIAARLGDLCKIEIGKTPSRGTARYWDKARETDNVWLSIADLTKLQGNVIIDSNEYVSDEAAKHLKPVKAGTLMMSFKLSIGKMAVAGRDLFTNEAIAALTINTNTLSREYLQYFLSGYDWDAETAGDHKLMGKTLNKAKLKELVIKFPPLSEQQRIVGILDQAFEGIANAKANAERNLANAKELFKSEFSSILKDADNWREVNLPAISTNLDGKRVPITRSDRLAGDVPYYGASGIVDYVKGFIFNENVLLISEDGANLLARSTPIAFSVKGKCWVNNHAHVLKFKDMTIQSYVERFINHINIERFVTGAAQPKLTQASLNKIPILMPPNAMETARVVGRLDELSDLCSSLQINSNSKIKSLDALQVNVLRQAFSGKL